MQTKHSDIKLTEKISGAYRGYISTGEGNLKFVSLKWHFPHSGSTFKQKLNI